MTRGLRQKHLSKINLGQERLIPVLHSQSVQGNVVINRLLQFARRLLQFAANLPSDEQAGFQEVDEHRNRNFLRFRYPNLYRWAEPLTLVVPRVI